MIRYGTLLVLLACGAFGAPHIQTPTAGGRIVNGTDAAPGQYPFMVSLQYFGHHRCGASLINPNWVLTAAHCLVDITTDNLAIRTGTNDISANDGVTVDVKKIVSHAGFDATDKNIHDIAVLELSTPLVLSDLIQPVRLPKQMEDTPGGTTATLIGWGRIYSGGPSKTYLQKVDLMVYSDKDCADLFLSPPYNSNICAGVPEGGKGQCNGDSGGPLLADGHQVGIVSYSVNSCASQGYPGVLTEVAYYIDWINEQIQ